MSAVCVGARVSVYTGHVLVTVLARYSLRCDASVGIRWRPPRALSGACVSVAEASLLLARSVLPVHYRRAKVAR